MWGPPVARRLWCGLVLSITPFKLQVDPLTALTAEVVSTIFIMRSKAHSSSTRSGFEKESDPRSQGSTNEKLIEYNRSSLGLKECSKNVPRNSKTCDVTKLSRKRTTHGRDRFVKSVPSDREVDAPQGSRLADNVKSNTRIGHAVPFTRRTVRSVIPFGQESDKARDFSDSVNFDPASIISPCRCLHS
ncbi:hypothetical protein EI94DRAFT_786729 [Lactarius quietus]|nr:hypothetical protein EI94DRAFT_786729 [Lactarius quietus]